MAQVTESDVYLRGEHVGTLSSDNRVFLWNKNPLRVLMAFSMSESLRDTLSDIGVQFVSIHHKDRVYRYKLSQFYVNSIERHDPMFKSYDPKERQWYVGMEQSI